MFCGVHPLVPRQSNNTSGYRGVSLEGKRWVARIKKDGKSVRIGLFDTAYAAHLAYEEEAKRLFEDFYYAYK